VQLPYLRGRVGVENVIASDVKTKKEVDAYKPSYDRCSLRYCRVAMHCHATHTFCKQALIQLEYEGMSQHKYNESHADH